MCTRYISPETAAVERHWHIGRGQGFRFARTELFPKYQGPLLRAAELDNAPSTELAIGQWWLVADGATERLPRAKTYNARFEDVLRRRSFRGPWLRGQRCIIPAECFYEPNWESGRHQPWCFRAADGAPWGLAGLWNEWIDPATGAAVLSYAMLTQNADHHDLMKRMHKPDPTLPAEAQDKRSVVPIATRDTAAWLFGSIDEATRLIRVPPGCCFDAGPEVAVDDGQGSLL